MPKESLVLNFNCRFTSDPTIASLDDSELTGEPGNPIFIVADLEVASCSAPARVVVTASLSMPDMGEILPYHAHDASSPKTKPSEVPLALGDRRRCTFILFPNRAATLSTRDIVFKVSSSTATPMIKVTGEGRFSTLALRMSDWIPPSRLTRLDSLERKINRWQTASETSCHLLLAPAGTGKSHAVARLRRCWLSSGAIEVSLDGQIHATDLAVIRRVLERAFPIEPRALGDNQAEILAVWLTRSGMAEARAGEVAAAACRDSGLESVDTALLADIMSTLLRRLSVSAPVVLLFEDAHKARPSALALLREVQRRLRTSRVMLFVTSRHQPDSADSKEQKKWYQGLSELLPTFDHMQLPALTQQDAVELIKRSIHTLQDHDAKAILSQVGTSPFGIREAINYILDYDLARFDEVIGEYRVLRRQDLRRALRLDKFTQATGLRIQRLREKSPKWLGVFIDAAALFGRSFPVQTCLEAAAVPACGDLAEMLGECERLQLLKPSSTQPDFWSFDHDLVRTAVLNRMSDFQQRSLARKLLAKVDASDDFVLGSLSYQAGLAEESIAHLTRSAERSSARSRHLDSVRALTIAIHIFNPEELVSRHGLSAQGATEELDPALQRAPTLCFDSISRSSRLPQLLQLLRMLIVSLVEVAGASDPGFEPALSEAFLLARHLMDGPALAELEHFEARWHFANGRLDEAVKRHQCAEERFATLDDAGLMPQRLNNILRLAVSYRQIGDLEHSVRELERAEAMRTPGDLFTQARILAESGAIYFYSDRVKVREYWTQSLAVARELAQPKRLLHALIDVAQLDIADDRLGPAHTLLQESLRIVEQYGFETEYIRVLLHSACISLVQDDLAMARRDLLEAEDIASLGANHRRLWRLRANLATLYELEGNFEQSYAHDCEVCDAIDSVIADSMRDVRSQRLGREFLGVANILLRAEISQPHSALRKRFKSAVLNATAPIVTAVLTDNVKSAPNLLGIHCKRLRGGVRRFVITE